MTTLEPPFKAEDMEGLFKAVTLGVYPPINQKYSKELAHMIKLMLQQKPKSRPSAEKILSSALIQKKVEELHLESIKEDETNQ
jgi:NIMA (never in mitosis gene a)-related kinase